MKIKIEIVNEEEIPKLLNEYDNNIHDVRALFDDFCDLMHDFGVIKIECFELDWNTYFSTDLSIILEQIPFILEKIRSKNDFVIDFYEQHLMRRILFKFDGKQYESTVHEFLEFKKISEIIELSSRDELFYTFTKIATDFLRLSDKIVSISGNKYLQDWARSLCLDHSL